MHNYQFKYYYRKTENGEKIFDYGFITSKDPDIINACEIAMLQQATKKGWFSCCLVYAKEY